MIVRPLLTVELIYVTLPKTTYIGESAGLALARLAVALPIRGDDLLAAADACLLMGFPFL